MQLPQINFRIFGYNPENYLVDTQLPQKKRDDLNHHFRNTNGKGGSKDGFNEPSGIPLGNFSEFVLLFFTSTISVFFWHFFISFPKFFQYHITSMSVLVSHTLDNDIFSITSDNNSSNSGQTKM